MNEIEWERVDDRVGWYDEWAWMEKMKQKIKEIMKQRSIIATYVSFTFMGLVLLLKVSFNWITTTKLPRANRLGLVPKFFPS